MLRHSLRLKAKKLKKTQTPNVCAVHSCKNSGDFCPETGREITYHKFPTNRALKKLWIRLCGNPAGINTQDEPLVTICSLHFQEKDFKHSRFTSEELKKNAYPTLALHEGGFIHIEMYLQKEQASDSEIKMIDVIDRRLYVRCSDTKVRFNEEVLVKEISDNPSDMGFLFVTKLNDTDEEPLVYFSQESSPEHCSSCDESDDLN